MTSNIDHPAHGIAENVHILMYERGIDFANLFETMKAKFGIDRVTIQSGGTLNVVLLRAGLIDEVSIVVAPLLVGGSTTSTLVDGEALHSVDELKKLKALEFISCNLLKYSYLHLRYRVIQETGVVPLS